LGTRPPIAGGAGRSTTATGAVDATSSGVRPHRRPGTPRRRR